MTTYTVTDRSGECVRSGLSIADAANEILSSDSRDWDIRPDSDGGFTLWSRQQVASRSWERTAVYSNAANSGDAEREIFQAVVDADWRGHDTAMTDQAYARMIAEAQRADEFWDNVSDREADRSPGDNTVYADHDQLRQILAEMRESYDG